MDRRAALIALYRAMALARYIDQAELELTGRGEAFFHVSGAGHEGAAALAFHLHATDWLHCHSRDKALMLARGLSAEAFFDSLLCKDRSHSRGRQMSAHMSDPSLRILSLTGPVGNSALQAVGVALATKHEAQQPITLCSLGEGSTQQGEFLEAVAEAVRASAPVMFLVEDNGWAISTRTTGQTFYSLPDGDAKEYAGRPMHYLDGSNAAGLLDAFGEIVARMRRERQPELVVLRTPRLANHTNADDQRIYRSAEELAQLAASDPLSCLRRELIGAKLCSAADLDAIDEQLEADVAGAVASAQRADDPLPIFTAKKPLRVELTHPAREIRGEAEGERLTMREAMRDALRHQLLSDPRVVLFGEDIEDPKGDVFGITKGLSTEFPGRVLNSPLSEATIAGVMAGRALAGQKPVALLQFADFLPLAFNQIATELATMHWRTDGGWQTPVIVLAPCGGYKPGLGPFHSHSLESSLAHVPGLDVFMPSTAGDAAGLLNAAFQSGRPTLLLYPKACLNDPQGTTSSDVATQFTPIGPARKVRNGRDLTLVAWGNAVRLCQQTADHLEKAGVETEVIDLRSLSPWDEHQVVASAEKTARLIVVHEDNHTCGFGAEVLATVAEQARVPVAMRRVTRPDTYVPCHFGNQIEVLPSMKRVLTAAAELLDLDLTWVAPAEDNSGLVSVLALGSGPADETVIVVECPLRVGQMIGRGDAVASLEATKSVFELSSPVCGVVEKVLVEPGQSVPVGSPLYLVRPSAPAKASAAKLDRSTPRLARKANTGALRVPRQTTEPRKFDVGVAAVSCVAGSRMVSNEELLLGSQMTGADVLRRTGIERRHWVSGREDAVGLAVQACWQALDNAGLSLDDIDMLVCSTTSPQAITPSMACQVLNGLAGGRGDALIQAYDINAACSGYLYALQAGYDYLQSTPQGRVLVVTGEVLSPLVDRADFDTAILFGDASSATVLLGENWFAGAKARLHRPELSAKGEDGSTLSVPLLHQGFIQMKGRKVFSEAVRTMIASLNRVCQRQGLGPADLKWVVPHQANQRILDAIQSRLGVDVYSNIRRHGNTSSTSIPLCLAELLPHLSVGDRLGLCAFGGGFTFGAGIMEAV